MAEESFIVSIIPISYACLSVNEHQGWLHNLTIVNSATALKK